MKKNITILSAYLVLFGANTVFGQTQKMVFVEEGTQASCPPCASQNPAFDALLEDNTDKAIVLKYQAWFPGFDQMFLDNPEEAEDRIIYNGFDEIGVPSSTINGVLMENDCNGYEGAPACLDQSEIDAEHAIISEFTMDISGQVLIDGQLLVTGSVTADQAITGDLRLRIVLAERVISSEDALGGTNGETEYNHVMKKFLTGTVGTIVSSDWAVGDQYIINETFDISGLTIYQMGQLELIAFVQNDDDKEVHQAAVDRFVDVSVANDVNAISSVNAISTFCSGSQSFSPVFNLQNGGNDDLVSADISYSIDGGTPQIFAWTGFINTLETQEIMLPEISYNAMLGVNSSMIVTVSNPNGSIDEIPSDNESILVLETSGSTEYTAQVKILTDNYPSETTWEILDADNDVVSSGGPYEDISTTYTQDFNLSTLGCYTFKINDEFGDGICCGFGNGSFELNDNNGSTLFTGGAFKSEELRSFEGTAVSSLKENAFESNFSILPNPAFDQVNVKFSLENSATTNISVTNILGQVVSNVTLGKLAAGVQNQVIDLNNLEAGIYQITINAGSSIGTKKVTLVK